MRGTAEEPKQGELSAVTLKQAPQRAWERGAIEAAIWGTPMVSI